MAAAFILAATNPQYVERLLQVQYMKTKSSKYVVYTNCFLFLYWHSEQFMYTTCSELVVFIYWTHNLMYNLSSYCGLVDGRISASDRFTCNSALYFIFIECFSTSPDWSVESPSEEQMKSAIISMARNMCKLFSTLWNCLLLT